MDKPQIIKSFLENDYPLNSLYYLYKLAINMTEEHLQEPILEIVYRHIDKDAKQLSNATKCKYEEAVVKILDLRKV